MTHRAHKRPDGKAAKAPNGKPITDSSDCCNCGGGGGSGPCICGPLTDGTTSWAAPDIDPRTGQYPGIPLRVRGVLNLTANMLNNDNGFITNYFVLPATDFPFDASWAFHDPWGPCTTKADLTTEPVMLIRDQFGNRATFLYAQNYTNGPAYATVYQSVAYQSRIGNGFFHTGTDPFYQGPPVGVGGVVVGTGFSLELPYGNCDFATEGNNAWSSGTPIVPRNWYSGLLCNSSTVAQIRAAFGNRFSLRTATMTGTQTFTRNGGVLEVVNNVAFNFDGQIRPTSDPRNVTTLQFSGTCQQTVTASLTQCASGNRPSGGALVDPAIEAIFSQYGNCKTCGDGNPMA